MAQIDSELLDILACPIGKADLKLEGDFLICTRCGARYPIKDGIPILMIDEAVLPEGINSVEELECWKVREEGKK